jgi:hypothetical protein
LFWFIKIFVKIHNSKHLLEYRFGLGLCSTKLVYRLFGLSMDEELLKELCAWLDDIELPEVDLIMIDKLSEFNPESKGSLK